MRRRLHASLYAQTYPGIGLGVVIEWVNHNDGGGSLELVVALPFLTLNAELIVAPRRPRTLTSVPGASRTNPLKIEKGTPQ